MRICVGDGVVSFDHAIEGLRFENNNVRSLGPDSVFFAYKLASSHGPLISDFVTHESSFSYSTFGIHIGQDDRLTFMGDHARKIIGDFVDCRKGSPTLHKRVSLSFRPSIMRKLIIPRGVAHTFDNLQGIVTRDEPIWHSDYGNEDWNVDNDLISVSRELPSQSFPVVKANRFRLPDTAHKLMSRLSQELLQNPVAYLSRFKVKIGGKDTYIVLEPTSWEEDQKEIQKLLASKGIPGLELRRAHYALTGPRSWTLVPTVKACVADVLIMTPNDAIVPGKLMHKRTRKFYTILGPEKVKIAIGTIDCRQGSPTFGQAHEIEIKSDPRIVIIIEPGVAYTLCSSAELCLRCEHEVYVDSNEPRSDLPMFGHDAFRFSDMTETTGFSAPTLRCPDDIVYLFGKSEVETFTANG